MTRPLPPQDPGDLTRFIEAEYHAKHRAQLPELATLSEKVEAVHAVQADVPARLAELLRRMIGVLEVHMKKEDLILFPAIRNAAPGSVNSLTTSRPISDWKTTCCSRNSKPMAQAMSDLHLPGPSKDRVKWYHALTPEPKDAFRAYSKAVIGDTDKRDS